MFDRLGPAMRRALAAVRASDPMEATRLLQDALGNGSAMEPSSTDHAVRETGSAFQPIPAPPRMGLGETINRLRSGSDLHALRPARAPDLPEGTAFLKRSISTHSGSRDYRLFVPSCHRPRGLVVMLHGCKQDAEDFAAGTAMNLSAEAEGMLVAYPTQARSSNATGCWNWFRPEDQRRGGGEPDIIAAMTRSVLDEYAVGPSAFIAGLSAGGAMAAVMAATYPDLYEAVGVHSGLPHGSAWDVSSALAAMRSGPTNHATSRPRSSSPAPRHIVFHGSRDHVVVPANAQALLDEVRSSHPSAQVFERSLTAGSRKVKHTEVLNQNGVPQAEVWLIEGAGHYWSGGDPRGSFSKPEGPSASREMMRFFLGRRHEG
jgi:poly(hydroxyalkanoate) depolymerase family esterase